MLFRLGMSTLRWAKKTCTQTEYPAPQTACCTGDVGYALREGPHDMTAWDWKQFCNFEAAQAAKD